MTTPTIYHLSVERFRRIKTLSWYPKKGVNVILGGGDVGKTTILDAIGLLLSPTNPTTLSETEYHSRETEKGFVIEAIMSLPPASGINNQVKPSWPWYWNGNEPVVPGEPGSNAAIGEPVYRLRVSGTADLELCYEIVQPDGTADFFPVGLRRSIGLVRLSGDDRNDRDLRLVQGSALDRLLSDKQLRSRLASSLAQHGVKDELVDGAKKALEGLDEAFQKESLPHGLNLGIHGSQGLSVAAMVGLTAMRNGISLPLSSWGAGTRRIAALAIAERNQGEAPITLVDEVERGLEPYRQRSLMDKLQDGTSQVFVTTHSPFIIADASQASIWYVDHDGKVGELEPKKTQKHRNTDPETFFARLALITEGATEFGFVTALLEKAIGSSLKKYGIHVSDGGGHESTLDLLEALADGGLCFGGFADDEDGKYPERWKKVAEKLDKLLFRWNSGCLEENIINLLTDEHLESLIVDPEDDKTGKRLRTLADRLGIHGEEKDFLAIKTKAGTELRALIVAAASGKVPADKTAERKQYKKHSQDWFKNGIGGHELVEKMFRLGAWPALKPQLLPFCNAVRKAIGLAEIQDVLP